MPKQQMKHSPGNGTFFFVKTFPIETLMGEAAESRLTQLHEGTPGLTWCRGRVVRHANPHPGALSATGPVRIDQIQYTRFQMASSEVVHGGLGQQNCHRWRGWVSNTVTQIRGAAHLGLAMDSLESEWNFSELTLALAKTPGYFALSVRAVDLKNAPQRLRRLTKSSSAWQRRRSRSKQRTSGLSHCARDQRRRYKTCLSLRDSFRRRPK